MSGSRSDRYRGTPDSSADAAASSAATTRFWESSLAPFRAFGSRASIVSRSVRQSSVSRTSRSARGSGGSVAVRDTGVLEGAEDVEDRVDLADLGEEAVPEAFSVGRAGGEPRYVDHVQPGPYDLAGLRELGEHVESGIGDLRDPHVASRGRERMGRDLDVYPCEGTEQARLAAVREPYDAESFHLGDPIGRRRDRRGVTVPETAWPPVTVGIDLAAGQERTAFCRLERDQGVVRVSVLRCDWTNDDLIAGIEGSSKVGIDSPLGWPVDFVAAVSAWNDHGTWSPGLDPRDPALQLRRTDRLVKDERKIRPLSVSTDKIGVVAFRAAHLLERLSEEGHEIDRTGCSGLVAEVYPAAALRAWGFWRQGYKTDRGVLSEMARGFLETCDWIEVPERERGVLETSHDAFDALVCALLAAQLAMGETRQPEPADQADAEVEGWIHVPSRDQPVPPR